MNKRLREIVQYKTHGKNKPFAELVGWTPQYLGKLLHGNDFGLKPVLAVLRALPEINARWLLLGEGQMLLDNHVGDLHSGIIAHIKPLIDSGLAVFRLSDSNKTAPKPMKNAPIFTGAGQNKFTMNYPSSRRWRKCKHIFLKQQKPPRSSLTVAASPFLKPIQLKPYWLVHCCRNIRKPK